MVACVQGPTHILSVVCIYASTVTALPQYAEQDLVNWNARQRGVQTALDCLPSLPRLRGTGNMSSVGVELRNTGDKQFGEFRPVAVGSGSCYIYNNLMEMVSATPRRNNSMEIVSMLHNPRRTVLRIASILTSGCSHGNGYAKQEGSHYDQHNT